VLLVLLHGLVVVIEHIMLLLNSIHTRAVPRWLHVAAENLLPLLCAAGLQANTGSNLARAQAWRCPRDHSAGAAGTAWLASADDAV
jgi:hypothetical protein